MSAQVVPHDQLNNLPPYCGKVEVAEKRQFPTMPDLPCFRPGWKPVQLPPPEPYEVPKLSSGDYSFAFNEVENGVEIVLTQVTTGKTKKFFQAGKRQVWCLRNHMNSLTDDLCGQWFVERKRNENVKQKPKQQSDEGVLRHRVHGLRKLGSDFDGDVRAVGSGTVS